MMDSISKEDLLKVIRRVAPARLLPELAFDNLMQAACDQCGAVEDTLTRLRTTLPVSASAQFAELETAVSPMLTDLKALTSAGTGSLNPSLLVEHVVELRQISYKSVLDLLGSVQKTASEELARLQEKDGKGGAAVLKTAVEDLAGLAQTLAALQHKVDSAIAPLRVRLRGVETWFDTVMQSFDERYTRGMKTWGIVISFAVVVMMNANVFQIYQAVTSSEQSRTSIMAAAQRVQTAALKTAPAQGSQPNTELPNAMSELQSSLSLAGDTGIRPLSRRDLDWWKSPELSSGSRIFLGWVIMTMLLSAGAPFWEDALESLFGLKSLIRKNSEQSNVEQKSGEGNPKS